MKRFVFATKTFEKEARSHSETSAYESFKKRLEFEGNDHPKSDEYGTLKGNYVKKRHGKNLRSIFTYKDIEIENEKVRIYVALRMMARGDKDYDRFKYQNTSDADRDNITGRTQIDWNELIDKVKSRLNDSEPHIVAKPDLSASEMCFISSPSRINHELMDVAIFESQEWTELLKSDTFKNHFDAAVIIEQYIMDHLGAVGDSKFEIPFKNYQGKKIVGYHKGHKVWYLLTITDLQKDIEINPDNIEVRRGYPYSSLDDKDAWQAMEQDKNSNFVLSEEEMEVVSKESSYPLFIGGRAGSGKSTVLQYLFAEIIIRSLNSKIDDEILLPPVYLSYSENLIENAKILASSLFEKNHAYQDEFKKTGKTFKYDIQPNMNSLFGIFQDVIKECIKAKNPSVLQERFSSSKYMSFSKFNNEWNKKFDKDPEASKKYGPSLSWYVIRTYIKGWDSESYLSPEDYQGIGEKNKNVTDETYQLIFDKVWSGWYSNFNDRWDDQDLVRYCISPDDNSQETYATERFSAVFCDEAQDFTRVEIDFILKVSSFSNRKINNVDDVKKLPFVFAGDEFQTLNPTGFSWDSIRAFFVDRLFSMVALSEFKDESNIEKPILLTKNYRSMPEIVRISNRIQLLRAARFGEESHPQIAHFHGKNSSVFCLNPCDKNVWNSLKEKKIVLITPIPDGQSVKEYVESGPLKDYIEIDLESGVPKDITIMNPVQAKGLEYPNVAVYGFKIDENDQRLSLDELLEWFNNYTEKDHQDEQSIGLKYLVSNTYVAATRACTKLYILDNFSENDFWAFAYSFANPDSIVKVESLENAMLKKTKSQWKKEDLGLIVHGDVDDITEENIVDKEYGKRIEEIEKRADNRGDENLMLQAAARYREHGNENGYFRCRAKAAVFKEDFGQAAEFFLKTELFDDAIRCYWNLLSENYDLNKQHIRTLADLTSKATQPIECEITKLCDSCTKAKISIKEFGMRIASILELVLSNPNVYFDINVWNKTIDQLARHIDVSKTTKTDLKRVIENKSELFKKGFEFSCQNIAKAAYSLKEYSMAVDLWEDKPTTVFPPEYYLSKIEVTSYPEKISYFEKAYPKTWQDKVVEEYVSNKGDLNIDNNIQRIISAALCDKAPEKLFRETLPQLLTATENLKQLDSILNAVKIRKISFNSDVISSLAIVKFGNTKEWSYPSSKYSDYKAKYLFDIVSCIKQALHGNALNQKRKIKDYCDDAYAKYRPSAFMPLLLTGIGIAYEKRGIHIDAIRYYEWAKAQTKLPKLRFFFDERWIVCKERQADRDISSDYWKEATDKRVELGIENIDIPQLPSIEYSEWVSYFNDALSITDDLFVKIEQEKPQTEDQNSENKTDFKILNKQSFRFGDYEICVIPKSKDIIIRYTNNEEELSVKIRKGIFPADGDFVIKDSRIYRNDENIKTPFRFSIMDNKVVLKVFQEETFTGVEITIEL